jgi:imidazolonepropionase-like amidohydrolase
MWAKVDSVLNSGLEAIARAHEVGVKMAFGSDLLGGMHRHQNEQFRLLGKVQPAIDAIRSATTTAAQLLGREGQIGVVGPGADADMLVLTADPLADIGDHLDVLIQNGRVVSP